MRVVWTRAALRGVLHVYDYIAEFNPPAAAAMADALMSTGDALEHFPFRGRLVPGTGSREIVAIRPYVIRYRISSQTVVILRVRHSARRPTTP